MAYIFLPNVEPLNTDISQLIHKGISLKKQVAGQFSKQYVNKTVAWSDFCLEPYMPPPKATYSDTEGRVQEFLLKWQCHFIVNYQRHWDYTHLPYQSRAAAETLN